MTLRSHCPSDTDCPCPASRTGEGQGRPCACSLAATRAVFGLRTEEKDSPPYTQEGVGLGAAIATWVSLIALAAFAFWCFVQAWPLAVWALS
jgi:hypothetical protein